MYKERIGFILTLGVRIGFNRVNRKAKPGLKTSHSLRGHFRLPYKSIIFKC